MESLRATTSPKKRSSLTTALGDFCSIVFLIVTGFFLVGYFGRYQFLDTGYQDWMYHAFRIESLAKHGLTSWDHVWSNGLNYWRLYQYIPHLMAVGLSKIAGLTLPNAMMWTVVIAFIVIRLEIYLFLRLLKIQPIYACLTATLSFAFIQQWIALKDFSIFMGLMFLPIYVYFWIVSMQQRQLLPLVAALSGIFWILHPVLGYSAGGLFVFAVIFSTKKPSLKEAIFYLTIYLCSSAAFLVPYFMYGYSYSNPILSLPQFLSQIIVKESRGLSTMYWIAIGLSWASVFIDPAHSQRWSKILLLYCAIYIASIMMAEGGYLPGFINQLQISRGIVVVGFILPFIFGVTIQNIAMKFESRFRTGVLAVMFAMAISQAIVISSRYGGNPVHNQEDPVQVFFQDKGAPEGSVLAENVSQGAFFNAGKVRFPVSYNEHLEPHPLAQRFRRLIKTDLSYSSLSQTQIKLIDAYVKVLGIQYIFMPKFSPTVDQLLNQEEQKKFEDAGEAQTNYETYTVLKSVDPISYAYIGDNQKIKESISFALFEKPGIKTDALQAWDDEMLKNAEFISSDSVKSVPLSFKDTDKLVIKLPSEGETSGKGLYVTQSYDPYWTVVVDGKVLTDVTIEPTSLRMIYVTLPGGLNGKELTLKHEWPVWYWPSQFLSLGVAAIAVLWFGASFLRGKLNAKTITDDAPPELKQHKEIEKAAEAEAKTKRVIKL